MLNKINVSVFEISLLPNYCVKYYDYIVKWCSGMAYNWCVSLDIGIILALRIAMRDIRIVIPDCFPPQLLIEWRRQSRTTLK